MVGRALCPKVVWLLIVLAFSGKPAAAQTSSSWVVGGSTGEPWAQVVERWIALDDSTRPGAVQPQEIPRGHSITRQLVRTGIATTQRNFFGYRWSLHKGPRQIEADTLEVGWHPRLWQAGGTNALAPDVMRGLVDGDELTAAFSHAARADGRPNGVRFLTLDLGVPVPIDSVVFFPPQSGLTSNNQRQRELFARAYEVSRASTPLEWLIFEDENISTGSSGYHALEEILGSTFANNNSVVSLSPPLGFTRFLRFKFGETTTTTLVAELQAFGHGYPQQARYLAAPHSFGEAVSLGRVTWKFSRYRQAPSGEIFADPTAPVHLNLQTRAGFDPEPKTFFIFDELGRMLEVDEQAYFDSPRVVERFSEGVAGFRALRADDTQNWNNWSVSYQNSGDEIRSSDGGGYFQFRFDISTEDPLAFGVLDSLSFEFSPLLVDRALAEISLDGEETGRGGQVEVPLGVEHIFVYDIRTVSGAEGRAGFDRIELDVPAAARFVDLEIDGVPATEGSDFTLALEDGRFGFTFGAAFVEDKTFRVRFSSAIFQSSVFMEGRLINSDSSLASLPQSIEAGDARGDVSTDGIQVVAGDVKFKILGDIVLSNPVLTPNGDGANDTAAVGFELFGLDGGRIDVAVYDLAGHRVSTLLSDRAAAGPYAPVWDGRNEDGNLVAPGLYLIRVEVEVDGGSPIGIEPVGVAY
ncbi:MAG: hypothetical protein GKR89_14205 [Candidatus Latescibacteria bacterium]|nr:hypothetical protein [Candidatus Latescibacterota bacterium]